MDAAGTALIGPSRVPLSVRLVQPAQHIGLFLSPGQFTRLVRQVSSSGQFSQRNAAVTFAICAKSERLDPFVPLEELLNGAAQGAGPFAMNDPDRAHPREDGIIDEFVQILQCFFDGLTEEHDFRPLVKPAVHGDAVGIRTRTWLT